MKEIGRHRGRALSEDSYYYGGYWSATRRDKNGEAFIIASDDGDIYPMDYFDECLIITINKAR